MWFFDFLSTCKKASKTRSFKIDSLLQQSDYTKEVGVYCNLQPLLFRLEKVHEKLDEQDILRFFKGLIQVLCCDFMCCYPITTADVLSEELRTSGV